VAHRQQMRFHLVVFLHLAAVVLDLLLHVEAVLHQVAVILLQLQQHAVALPVLLAVGVALAVVLIDYSHVLLVEF
jgi:hypothetical protein